MSLYWHLGYLKQIELTIHIHDLLPTVKLPLALTVDEVLKGDPSSGFCWMTPFGYSVLTTSAVSQHNAPYADSLMFIMLTT
ncbi:hypothetical protein ACX03_12985 [Vibrio parahaemolyticus]|nr:hypothetical protein ACS91_17235 [Vibrio parahaemolyticus]KOY45032.1 hypothetical protein ACX03_12985 [Vibrio parahaemolyticus]